MQTFSQNGCLISNFDKDIAIKAKQNTLEQEKNLN